MVDVHMNRVGVKRDLGEQAACVQVQNVNARRDANGNHVRMSGVALFQLHDRPLLVRLSVQVGVLDFAAVSRVYARLFLVVCCALGSLNFFPLAHRLVL